MILSLILGNDRDRANFRMRRRPNQSVSRDTILVCVNLSSHLKI
jgi:hypothetical protein